MHIVDLGTLQRIRCLQEVDVFRRGTICCIRFKGNYLITKAVKPSLSEGLLLDALLHIGCFNLAILQERRIIDNRE
jgi:hypothetical protein